MKCTRQTGTQSTKKLGERFAETCDDHSVSENWIRVNKHLLRMMEEYIPSKL